MAKGEGGIAVAELGYHSIVPIDGSRHRSLEFLCRKAQRAAASKDGKVLPSHGMLVVSCLVHN